MRRVSQNNHRRREAVLNDQPMIPKRQAPPPPSAVASPQEMMNLIGPMPNPASFRRPRISNTTRKTILKESRQRPVVVTEASLDDGNGDGMPGEINVRPRLLRMVSEITMTPSIHPSDLVQDGDDDDDDDDEEFILPNDDYLDDEQFEAYLKQLGKDEEQRKKEKKKERESMNEIIASARESLLSDMMETSSNCTLLNAAAEDDEYLEMLICEQLEVQQRYSDGGIRRIEI